MNRTITIIILACLAGCAAGGGGTPPSPSPPSAATAHAKQLRCMNYPGGYGYCMHTCSHENALAHGAAARCQETCVPNAQPNQPPVCARPAGCEFAHMEEGRQHATYASCIAKCSSIPIECQ